MAAVDDALKPLKPGFGQGGTAAGDALLDILETLRMSENGDVAVSEADEAADRGVAAGVAIGAHGVESGRLGPAVDEHCRRQAGPVGFTLERRHRLAARGDEDQAVDAARGQRLDAAALLRPILARGDDEKIIAVAFGERLDPMH